MHRKPQMTFEFIESNKILFKDSRDSSVNDVIDYETYNLFVDEKQNTNRNDIELIPNEYFNFLKTNCDVDQYVFDEEFWKNDVEPKLSPFLKDKIFKFQKEAVYKMIKMKKCLNASSMGIGKSLQGLTALSYFKTHTKGDVIICPGYLRKNWENEAKLWLPEHLHDGIVVIKKAGKNDIAQAIRSLLNNRGITIVSYDMAANIFSKLKPNLRRASFWNTVIMDESHFIKDIKTKRFKMLQGAIKCSKQIFLLTGTPSPNRPKELYAQFSFLRNDIFKNYRNFAVRYCDGHLDYFNNFNDKGSSKLKELAHVCRKIIIRLRREDVLDDLPEKTRNATVISPKSKSNYYNKLKKEFKELLDSNDEENNIFKLQTLASEMFRETAKIKEQPVLEYMSDYIKENDRKTVVFCKHQVLFQSLRTFFDTNNMNYISIDGSTNMNSRPVLIDTFLNNESYNYALLTIGSCQTGLNIKGVDRMIFVELSWSPAELAQCEARITRLGSMKSSLEYTYLLCEDTIDEMVFNKLITKNNIVSKIVDRGKNYGDFDFEGHRPKKKIKLSHKIE